MTEKDHPPSPTGSDGSDGSEKSAAFKVPKPKFGGVKQTDAKTISPWTGGKPNNTMTGLEEPTPKSINSKQYRPTHVGSQTKSQEARVEGLTNKFSILENHKTKYSSVYKLACSYTESCITSA